MATQPGVGYTFTTSSQGENFNITQPWSLWAYLPETNFNPYDNGDDTFSITPGTLNGVIPCCDGISLTKLITTIPAPKVAYDWAAASGGYQSCYIYMQAGAAAGTTPPTWPAAAITDTGYPVIYGYPYTMDSDDATGYLLLAIAQKKVTTGEITFSRFVTTSMWSERHKYSQPDSAIYYYYRA